jgi:hypothetical protein
MRQDRSDAGKSRLTIPGQSAATAAAQAMEFSKGETVEWIVADKGHLILARKHVPPNPIDVNKNDTSILSERLGEFLHSHRGLSTTS